MNSDQLKMLAELFSKAGKSLPSLLSAIVLIALLIRPVDGSEKLDEVLDELKENQVLAAQAKATALENSNRLERANERQSCQIRTLDALSRESNIRMPCQLDSAN